ncbi:MAG: hypothetical protein GX605_10165 [Chloroflexi bacterium]|nr:hypothetical protein [Chloroflexota bacterium]
MELLYADHVQDDRHIESSYVVYGSEYGEVRALYRFADELTDEQKQRRERDIQRSFHPNPLRRLGRGLRSFLNTATVSLNEVVGLLIGRMKASGRYMADRGDASLTRLSGAIIGQVGVVHDPLLER